MPEQQNNDVVKRNRRFANTVITLVVVLFLLFVMWHEDAQFIIQTALASLKYLSDTFYGFTSKLFLIMVAYIVFRLGIFILVEQIMRRLHGLYNAPSDFSVTRRMSKFIIWTLFTFFVLVVLFEDNFGSVVTGLGLVGFGITFALQKPILNFVGWLTISFKRIYTVGDRIHIGGTRGDVVEISMMNTTVEALIETGDMRSGKLATLPNELVLTGEVENYTKTSNYVLTEVPVNITYESDLKKAEKLLYDAATRVTKDNQQHLKKRIEEETASIEQTLLQLGQTLVNATKREQRRIKKEMEKLEKEEGQLKAQEDVLAEEFQPKVRMELKDSSVELQCFFQAPYDKIRSNKTKVIKLFLESAAKEKGVEIAYPHIQIVKEK